MIDKQIQIDSNSNNRKQTTMNIILSESDEQILINILDLANQRYMKQSRVHTKSSFNILRILSAYKQACYQFPLRKQHIYNWIMLLTKNYNPQTLSQWHHAIQQIKKNQLTSPSLSKQNMHYNSLFIEHHNSIKGKQSEYQFQGNNLMHLTSLNSRKCQQNCSYDINNSNRQSRIRGSHSRMQQINNRPISSKMHYISFEPDIDNKQNIDCQNTLKSQCYKEDNQPTKTPGQQSFINNLPVCYGSPFVLSKITNNTKQITQVEFEEYQNCEEWSNMKLRASIFRDINLKMKTFSALLANFQAFQDIHLMYKKSHSFQMKLEFRSLLQCFTKIKNKKNKEQQNLTRSNHKYNTTLTKKAFKILHILYQLKIKQRKGFQIQLMNTSCFEFLITLMLGCTSQQKTETDGHHLINNYEQKSIRYKTEHFKQMQDCQKLEMISSYFSPIMKISKVQIANFFQLYRKCRMVKAFKIMSQNSRKFIQQKQKLHNYLKKKVIIKIISQVNNKINNKARVLMMRSITQSKTLSMCFKALLQYQLSHQIYIKRQQFVTNQNKIYVKKHILSEWKRKLQNKLIKKLDYSTRVTKAISQLNALFKAKYMDQFRQNLLWIKTKQDQYQQAQNMMMCQKIFNYLLTRVNQKKLYAKIKTKKQNYIKNKCFKAWFRLSSLFSVFTRLSNRLNLYALQILKNENRIIINSQKISSKRAFVRKCQGIHMLKLSYKHSQQQQYQKIKTIHKIILKKQYNLYTKIIKNEINNKRKALILQSLEQKTKKIINYIQTNRKEFLFKYLLTKLKQTLILKNKSNILQIVFGNKIKQINNQYQYKQINKQVENGRDRKIHTYNYFDMKIKKQTITHIKQQIIFKNAIKSINQNKTEILRSIKKSYLNNLKHNKQTMHKIHTSQHNFQAKIKHKYFKIISKNYLDILYAKQQAKNKYEIKLKFKSLLALARSTLAFRKIYLMLQQNIRINDCVKVFNRLAIKRKQNNQCVVKQQFLIKKLAIHFMAKLRDMDELLLHQTLKLKNNKKKKNIHEFIQCCKLQRQDHIIHENQIILIKKLAVMRLNQSVFQFVLARKQMYMAVKYKAINLCNKSFRALYGNYNCRKNPIQNQKKFKIYQHIQTSYSSL